ncbi:MAG: hypothetical protein EOO28_30390 [Comamonadaceae bacterium]|nr:MAG: hypothetical protein EOO28_30390 [Comamonadaceae bacterium]
MDAEVAAAVILEMIRTPRLHAETHQGQPSTRRLQGYVSGALAVLMSRRGVLPGRAGQVRGAALKLVFLQRPDLSVNWPAYANDDEFQGGLARGRIGALDFLGT